MGGARAGLRSLNYIGLQRGGASKEELALIQKAYGILFDKEKGTFAERIEMVSSVAEFFQNPRIMEIIAFVKNPSKNDILQPE
jgi:acyl-[acyl carrier protein]--UDP-N-acetylglucosamine O-acyltransferase